MNDFFQYPDEISTVHMCDIKREGNAKRFLAETTIFPSV